MMAPRQSSALRRSNSDLMATWFARASISSLQQARASDQVSQKGPHVRHPQLPDADLRLAPPALVLVARDLVDAIALLERLHQHFLLDGRQVRRQPQPLAHVFPN